LCDKSHQSRQGGRRIGAAARCDSAWACDFSIASDSPRHRTGGPRQGPRPTELDRLPASHVRHRTRDGERARSRPGRPTRAQRRWPVERRRQPYCNSRRTASFVPNPTVITSGLDCARATSRHATFCVAEALAAGPRRGVAAAEIDLTPAADEAVDGRGSNSCAPCRSCLIETMKRLRKKTSSTGSRHAETEPAWLALNMMNRGECRASLPSTSTLATREGTSSSSRAARLARGETWTPTCFRARSTPNEVHDQMCGCLANDHAATGPARTRTAVGWVRLVIQQPPDNGFDDGGVRGAA